MLKPKRKFTKKELKQDKFILYTLQVQSYLKEHTAQVIRIGIAIFVVILVVTFYVRSKESANRNAATELGQAQIELNLGKKKEAITRLKDLIDRFEGTSSAGQACYLLARIYWEDEEYSNAKQYFKKYLDDYGNDKILTPAAMAGYADYLSREKKYLEAAKLYEDAAKEYPEFPEAAAYLYSGALAYKEAGEKAQAVELVERLLRDYENSTYKNRAELLLEILQIES